MALNRRGKDLSSAGNGFRPRSGRDVIKGRPFEGQNEGKCREIGAFIGKKLATAATNEGVVSYWPFAGRDTRLTTLLLLSRQRTNAVISFLASSPPQSGIARSRSLIKRGDLSFFGSLHFRIYATCPSSA